MTTATCVAAALAALGWGFAIGLIIGHERHVRENRDT